LSREISLRDFRATVGSNPAGAPAFPCRQLTPNQARFIEEYLIDLNAAAAYVRAGYAAKWRTPMPPA